MPLSLQAATELSGGLTAWAYASTNQACRCEVRAGPVLGLVLPCQKRCLLKCCMCVTIGTVRPAYDMICIACCATVVDSAGSSEVCIQ